MICSFFFSNGKNYLKIDGCSWFNFSEMSWGLNALRCACFFLIILKQEYWEVFPFNSVNKTILFFFFWLSLLFWFGNELKMKYFHLFMGVLLLPFKSLKICCHYWNFFFFLFSFTIWFSFEQSVSICSFSLQQKQVIVDTSLEFFMNGDLNTSFFFFSVLFLIFLLSCFWGY